MNSTSPLKDRIERIKSTFDIHAILDRQAQDSAQIARYYRANRLIYKLFNSSAGFVHMAISHDGVFKAADFLEQARIVEAYIVKAKAHSVLELATGKAANVTYLAEKHPDVQFYGLDLPNGQLPRRPANAANLKLQAGDFHDLQCYENNSIELVFIVEALCHARSKPAVMAEVYRVLKPGGYFIVFDGYTSKPSSEMNPDETLASNLIYKSMMVHAENHHYADFRKWLQAAGLTMVEEKDLSQAIMPNVKRFERQSKKVFNHPVFARLLKTVQPEEVTANTIAGFLMPLTLEAGLHQYWLTVGQKQN